MITITIIILTSLISYQAFKDYSIADKLIFQPAVVRDGEWYRLITYGLLHADLTHLIFNMFTFYLFGRTIESFFKSSLGFIPGSIAFILLYLGGLLFSILPTYLKEKDNYYYKGLGCIGCCIGSCVCLYTYLPNEFDGYTIYTYQIASLSIWIYLRVYLYVLRQKSSWWYQSLCTCCRRIVWSSDDCCSVFSIITEQSFSGFSSQNSDYIIISTHLLWNLSSYSLA